VQKVQAYLKTIISTQCFQFPHVNKKNALLLRRLSNWRWWFRRN